MKRISIVALALLAISCSPKVEKTETPPLVQEQVATQDTTPVAEKLTHITDENQFNTYFSKPGRLLVVDLYADWCGPCKMIAPDFAALSSEYGEKADFLKINVDSNEPLAKRFNVQSIPLILIIKDGKVLEEIMGARKKEEYKELIVKHL